MADFSRFNASLDALKASVDDNSMKVDELIDKVNAGGGVDQGVLDAATDKIDAAKAVVDAANAKADGV